MREQARAGPSALDRPGRKRRLGEALAARAGEARPHDPVHNEPAGDVFEFLGHILADPAQRVAAIGTTVFARSDLDLHARDVVRDRAALRLVLLLDVGEPQRRGHGGGRDLARLQRQLQLIGGLGRCAKSMSTVAGELMTQLLDQDRLGLHLGQKTRREGPQLLRVFRQRSGIVQHGDSLSDWIP